ncbi:hypothetical protein [Rhodoplanes sp. SY1]|uniref:hypothetical protein n=1 Tax=Rhodoplanes sp. SY1 TaxID=3166646 RepID=UPI0038B4FC79
MLAANAVAAEGTFMHALHDRYRFDAALFDELLALMAVIAAQPARRRSTAVRRQASHVHRAILTHFIHHLLPVDGYRMRRFPGRGLQDRLDRLDWVFVPVIDGTRGYGPFPEPRR